MRDTSCISDQDLKDFFASLDVEWGNNAESAVKQLSDKAIIRLHDKCERERNRKLHDRRMTKKPRSRNAPDVGGDYCPSGGHCAPVPPAHLCTLWRSTFQNKN